MNTPTSTRTRSFFLPNLWNTATVFVVPFERASVAILWKMGQGSNRRSEVYALPINLYYYCCNFIIHHLLLLIYSWQCSVSVNSVLIHDKLHLWRSQFVVETMGTSILSLLIIAWWFEKMGKYITIRMKLRFG